MWWKLPFLTPLTIIKHGVNKTLEMENKTTENTRRQVNILQNMNMKKESTEYGVDYYEQRAGHK